MLRGRQGGVKTRRGGGGEKYRQRDARGETRRSKDSAEGGGGRNVDREMLGGETRRSKDSAEGGGRYRQRDAQGGDKEE